MAHTNEEVVRELYATFGADNREKLAAFSPMIPSGMYLDGA
jgi:hypothetical protein